MDAAFVAGAAHVEVFAHVALPPVVLDGILAAFVAPVGEKGWALFAHLGSGCGFNKGFVWMIPIRMVLVQQLW